MRKNIFKYLVVGMLILAVSGCGSNVDNKKKIADKPKIVVPVLKMNEASGEKEFMLKSQFAKYTKKDKSEMEIYMVNSFDFSCQKPTLNLKEGDEVVKLKLSKNKGIEKTEYRKGGENSAEGEILYSDKSKNLKFAEVLAEVTDLNDSIIRGKLKLEGVVEGEFFAAVCK